MSPTPSVTSESASSTPGSFGDQAAAANRQQAECLQRAGWSITLRDDGYEANVPPDQRKVYDADERRCIDEVGRRLPPPRVTAADYRRLYEHNVKMVECLRKAGYPPLESTPSEQRFIGDALRNGGAIWSAWSAVVGATPPELEKQCPQVPADW